MRRRELATVWLERVTAYSRSGLTIQKFCEGEQISTTTFYKWRRRLGLDDKRDSPPALEFVEVGGDGTQASVELVTKSGVVVRVGSRFDSATLGRVLDVLRDR